MGTSRSTVPSFNACRGGERSIGRLRGRNASEEIVEKIAEEIKSNQHAAFDPSFTTLNVGVIHGGSAKNVLAGECRFTLEWRPIPTQPSDHVLHLLNAAIKEEQRADPDFVCEVDASRADSGFETAPDSRLIKLLENATGRARTRSVVFLIQSAFSLRMFSMAVGG